MLKEFKEFAMRGNVVDMAVGIIIGAAFGTIVNSLVADVIMPPIGLLLGNIDFANLFVVLKEGVKGAGPVHKSKSTDLGIRCGPLTLAMLSRRLYTKARTNKILPILPCCMYSNASGIPLSERLWVPACTIRLYFRAASTILRLSQMLCETGFST